MLSAPRVHFIVESRLYRSFVIDTVAEFNQLATKSESKELSAWEVERLIQLDGIVESLRGKNLAIPKHLKTDALESIGQLIHHANLLVERVKNELGEEQDPIR